MTSEIEKATSLHSADFRTLQSSDDDKSTVSTSRPALRQVPAECFAFSNTQAGLPDVGSEFSNIDEFLSPSFRFDYRLIKIRACLNARKTIIGLQFTLQAKLDPTDVKTLGALGYSRASTCEDLKLNLEERITRVAVSYSTHVNSLLIVYENGVAESVGIALANDQSMSWNLSSKTDLMGV